MVILLMQVVLGWFETMPDEECSEDKPPFDLAEAADSEAG